jgi:hypothetical protein
VIVDIAVEGAGLPQWALFGLGGWIVAIRPMEAVGSATGRDLIKVLTGTAATHAATGLLLALGSTLGHVDRASDDVVPLLSSIGPL